MINVFSSMQVICGTSTGHQLRQQSLCAHRRTGLKSQKYNYSLHLLGSLWAHQDCFEAAKHLLSSAFGAYEVIVGPHNEKTHNVMVELADVSERMGQIIEAEFLFKRVLEVYKKSSTLNKIAEAWTKCNLTLLYKSRGKTFQAELLLRETLAVDETQDGLGGLQTMQTAVSLASVLNQQKKFAEAEKLYKRAATNLKRSVGAHHPATLEANEGLASMYFDSGQWDQAEVSFKLVIECRNEIHDSSHEDNLRNVRQLAITYLGKQNLDILVNLAKEWGLKERLVCMELGRLYL